MDEDEEIANLKKITMKAIKPESQSLAEILIAYIDAHCKVRNDCIQTTIKEGFNKIENLISSLNVLSNEKMAHINDNIILIKKELHMNGYAKLKVQHESESESDKEI